MTRSSTLALVLAGLAPSCLHTPAETEAPPRLAPSEPSAPEAGLRLVQSDGAWFVTGLSEDAAALVEQGKLFAVMRPIEGTSDSRGVALMKALGPAQGRSVQVAEQCLSPKARLVKDMRVVPILSTTERKIGPCIGRTVEEGQTDRGEAYVVLNIGSGVGVQPGDQFILLGQAVVAGGHVPLALDTDHDGYCQVPPDPTLLKATIAVCMVVERPRGVESLRSLFVAWMPR